MLQDWKNELNDSNWLLNTSTEGLLSGVELLFGLAHCFYSTPLHVSCAFLLLVVEMESKIPLHTLLLLLKSDYPQPLSRG